MHHAGHPDLLGHAGLSACAHQADEVGMPVLQWELLNSIILVSRWTNSEA